MHATSTRLLSTIVLGSLIAFATSRTFGDDWTTFQHDTAHTGRSSATFDPTLLTKTWGSTQYVSTIVVGNQLYAVRSGTGTTSVGSFNLFTGQQNWSRSLQHDFTHQLTYVEGLLVFGSVSPDGPIFRVLDAATGTPKYSVNLPSLSSIPSIPVIGRNSNAQLIAYFSTENNFTAIALGATSGAVLWSKPGPSGVLLSPPTLVGNSVITSSNTNHWVYDQLTGASQVLSGGDNASVVYDAIRKQYYVENSTTHRLIAYSYSDSNNIAEVWQSTMTGGMSAVLGADGAIYRSTSSSLYKLDPVDGHVIASVSGLDLASSYTPIISGNSIFIHSGVFPNIRTKVFDINTLEQVMALGTGQNNAHGSSLTVGAIFDGGIVVHRQGGFDVYLSVPEPSSALLALSIFALLASRRSRC
jgi:hypothetical protein